VPLPAKTTAQATAIRTSFLAGDQQLFAGHRKQAQPRLLPVGNQQVSRATTIKQTP
jgi:hypothetical protein